MATEGYHIGGSTPLESYLRMDRVLEVALESNSEAIHPGYGFLSENPTFADLCEQNGVKFIGPPSLAMKQMASKSESKDIMIKANVPVTPGYHGENQDPEFLLEEARKIKFPVMIKAVMGGGGKGMKIAWNEAEFMENLESAKRESRKSFDDERVLIEKYIERPKHYEIQVFGDSYGNYVYLFERDCSIQRRHQKIIEEAPSAVDAETRKMMGETAVAAAKAVGYVNAGTVEFLYDLDTDEYYFMEMNTRLQVEHPISEMITGVDLVEWQLKVASGQKLPLSQDELRINGHAIEGRVYSEDPWTFLPGRGTVDYYKEPTNARIDSGVESGTDVGIFYDPMISKLIVWGEDRDIAVQRMRQALSEYKIGGMVTNLPFLSRVLANTDFEKFKYDLKFIDENFDELVPKGIQVPEHVIGAGVNLILNHEKFGRQIISELQNFRLNHAMVKHFNLQIKYSYSQNTSTLYVNIIKYNLNR